MEAVREEIFGSVACVLPFETEEEAVRRANDSKYGLAGKCYLRWWIITYHCYGLVPY